MTNSIAELRDLNLQLESLKARKAAIKKQLAEHRDAITDQEIADSTKEAQEIRTQIESVEEKIKEAQERAEKENRNKEIKLNMENEIVEKRSTFEYRKAFMDYVQRGIKSDVLEFRVDAATTTTTAATVIPTTVMDEIIKESKISGNILSKVRKMNVKGGVRIPTLTAIPTASWITEETSSDRQKVETGSVTFSYYGLEVKIAQTLLSEYTSIEAFEREFAVLAVEAMTNAKEIAIFNGTGSGQPTGILKTSGINTVTLKAAEVSKYDKLVAAIGKLPVGYRTGAEFAMASGTWDAIVGMVDLNGQPVARVNYGLNGQALSLFGYPVNLVEEDRLKSIGNATAGTDYIIVFGNFSRYAINSNGNLGVYKYRDEDKNQDVTKALEFIDGKVLDAKAFLAIKLGTTGSV